MAQVADIAWDIGLMVYGLALLVAAVGMVLTLVEGATSCDLGEEVVCLDDEDGDRDSDSCESDTDDADAEMDFLVRERVASMRALDVEAVGPPH
jgi:hypothetical protein